MQGSFAVLEVTKSNIPIGVYGFWVSGEPFVTQGGGPGVLSSRLGLGVFLVGFPLISS